MFSLLKHGLNQKIVCHFSKLFESTTIVGDIKKTITAPSNTQKLNDVWGCREKLAKPIIQRDEKSITKVYYAPTWKEPHVNPLKCYGMTPDKWEYYNKIVWPKNYIVPETGLPKAREVFHCRESVHYSPKRMWQSCNLIQRMNVVDALNQLKFKQTKGTLMLAEVIEEAMARAKTEFHIINPDNMFVAEAFGIQEKIIKGRRRHAKEKWHPVRYRYIHIFVRLEEGIGPPYVGRAHRPDNWENMENYYKYLRNRNIKYSL